MALPLQWLTVLGLLVVGAAAARANTYYVNGSGGNDANSGASWTAAFATVQAGINAASTGDQVWVQTGTYVQNITLKDGVQVYGGFNGSETALSQRNWIANVTILDGNNSGSVVTIPAGVGSTAQIDGFTIQHGNTSNFGGGIYSLGSATISNNTITHNIADSGGGIECDTGSPAISNNTITANTATNHGGGIFSRVYGAITISGNTISGNSAQNAGGLSIYQSTDATLTGNTVSGNTSQAIGGVEFTSASGNIIGNTISGNNSTDGSVGGVVLYHYTGAFNNNTVTNNISYSTAGVHLDTCNVTVIGNDISWNNSSTSQYGSMGESGHAGGLDCYSSTATISNNTFTGNQGGAHGGAMILVNSTVQVLANTITYNVAALNSGGIECEASTATFANNLIAHNTALQYGGGISIASGDPVSIVNNTIVDNSATLFIGGVNIYSDPPNYSSVPHIVNNIIAFNLKSGIYQNSGSSSALSHNCVYGNTLYNYLNVTPGSGDISVNPLFIDRAALDYRLQPASPCIDTGDNTLVWSGELDLDGNGRIYGPHVDIGAYETQPALIKFSIKPGTIAGSLNATGTLTLDMPAPSGGANVLLINGFSLLGTPAASVPVSVIIPAGAITLTFPITTTAVSTSQTGAITALYGDAELSAKLTVRPIGVKTFSIKPSKIVGGNSVTGTVTLEAAAGPGDITVSFSSSDPTNVPTPASITIPAGSLTGTVTISTNAMTANETVTITATANSISKSAKLTVTP